MGRTAADGTQDDTDRSGAGRAAGFAASGARTLASAADGLARLRAALDGGPLRDSFAAAVALILKAPGRVIVTGVGKSGHVGAKLAATLASTGTPAHFVHPTEASHGDLGMIRREDAILALSWSGETRELGDIVAHSRRFAVPLMALTGGADSMLARAADVALVLPQAPEACPHNLAPTTSTTMQIALGDALAVALLEGRGFTAADFRDLHPGGRLGERLKTVGQLMLTGALMPLAAPEATVGEAVGEITSKGFGIVGVLGADGRLSGVITDGDIRRFVAAQAATPLGAALGTKAAAIMTRTPVTVAPDLLAASAVATMEDRRISALFVVEDGRPVGIVTLLQFLRSGVV
jgi:arabinose-5-phosphate isomerase